MWMNWLAETCKRKLNSRPENHQLEYHVGLEQKTLVTKFEKKKPNWVADNYLYYLSTANSLWL